MYVFKLLVQLFRLAAPMRSGATRRKANDGCRTTAWAAAGQSPGFESRYCTDKRASDSRSVLFVFTLICKGDTCHHADYAPPLASCATTLISKHVACL